MDNLLTKLDDTERAELAKSVVQKFQSSADFYSSKFELFRRCWNEYGKKKDDKDSQAEPDIKIGLAYSLTENVVARCVQAFLGNPSIITKPKRRDHAEKAPNYDQMMRGYRASPGYRIGAIDSTRERVVCGTAWEVDEWANEYSDGVIWVRGMIDKVADMDIPVVSSVVKMTRKISYKGYSLAKKKFPVDVGYRVRWPSIFNIFPHPGRLRIKDCEWIIERVPYISVADLEKAKYTNPETGELESVYDLKEIKTMQKAKRPVRPVSIDEDTDYQTFLQEYNSAPEKTHDTKDDGVDAVQLLILRTDREIITIANGAHVIQYVKDLYHKPGKRIRARYYTQSRHSIYGVGLLEPILDLIDELHDVHNLSMQNWFREVNRMIAYREKDVLYPDDLDRRAGGQVRLADDAEPGAIMPLQTNSPARDMITAESNLRGLTENIVSVADLSPGALGTKPYHNTYGGLMEIQATFARRFGVIAALDQAATMDQYDSAYWLHEQFMFDDVLVSSPGSNKGAISFKREDIDTGGEGFLFIASDDPSFGDTQVQRNQNMVLMDLCLRYVQQRAALNRMDWRDVKADEVLEDVFESFGRYDVDKLLVVDEGVTSPEKEYELMLQGVMPQVNPKENLTWHLIKHMIQLEMLKNSGQNIPPQVMTMLINHISNTQEAVQAVGENPEMFAAEYAQAEAMKDTADVSMPQINMGQNLPQAQGAGNASV